MTPRVPINNGGVGKSHTGAAQYFLHDSGHANTDERVLWTHTHNLATDDPELAARIMAATAKSARQIQERHHAAEQAKLPEDERTPFRAHKPSFNHAFHYSLSWSGEKEAHTLTREEMTRAAIDSLRALGADHLQALIVAHDHETAPHVHVLLNRVNPETGMTEKPESNSQRRLSAWALEYEKQRGYVLCPNRERNAMLRGVGSRYQSEEVTPQDYRARQAAAAAIKADPEGARVFADEQRSLDRVLAKLSKDTAASHKDQLDSMFFDHRRRKAAINHFADRNRVETENTIRDQWMPRFAFQKDQQNKEKDAWIEREASLYGKALNFRETLKSIREDKLSGEGGLRGIADSLFNAAGRLRQLEKDHERAQREQAEAMRLEIETAKTAIEQERKASIHANYERLLEQKVDTAERHAAEKLANDEAWQQRAIERQEAWKEFAAERSQLQDAENNRIRTENLEAQRGLAQDQFEKAGTKDAGRQDDKEETDEGMSEAVKTQADAFKKDLAEHLGRGASYEDQIAEAKESYRASKEQTNDQDRDYEQDE